MLLHIGFSLDFDYLTIAIISVLLLSAFFVGWWISKHYSRVVASIVDDEDTRVPSVTPSVSVIVYSHYGLDMLKRTLPLMLRQNYDNYEVVVVDDNYDINTKDYLSALSLDEKRLLFTTIPQGTLNLSRKKLALTLGIKAAHSDYVLVTESNCEPISESWLKLMMSKCVTGIELVIGNSGHIDSERNSAVRAFYDFDQVSAKVRYLSYALNGNPYRADGFNFVFQRKLFFDVKGFSATLNLHHGDDDLFVRQIATSTNTAVQLAPDAQLKTIGTSTVREMRDYKFQHIFTEKYLHTWSKYAGAIYLWLNWMLLASIVALLVVALQNVLSWILCALTVGCVWFVQIYAFDRAAKLLGYKPLKAAVPIFTIIAPIVNIWFRIIGYPKRKSNYTYQRKRRD